MPENKHYKTQRAEDIAREWAELDGGGPRKRPRKKLGLREKIIIVGAVYVAASVGTVCALRPTQYDRIKQLPVAAYHIKPGDTFHTLSERFVLDQDKYSKSTITNAVIDMNPEKDPAKLRPGTRIVLPVDGLTPEQVEELGGRFY